MRSDAVEGVDPHRAHRASRRISFSIHEVVNDERSSCAAEQLAQTHRPDLIVRAIEVSGTFMEDIVRQLGAGRQRPAERRDPLDTPEHFHLRQSELFPLLEVFTRFVNETGVTKHAVGVLAIDVFGSAGDRLGTRVYAHATPEYK